MGPRKRASRIRSEQAKKRRLWMLTKTNTTTTTVTSTTNTVTTTTTTVVTTKPTTSRVYPIFSPLKETLKMADSPQQTLEKMVTRSRGKKSLSQEGGFPIPSISGLSLSPLAVIPGPSGTPKMAEPRTIRKSLPMKRDIDVGFVKEEPHSDMDEMAMSDEDLNDKWMPSMEHDLVMKNEINEDIVKEELYDSDEILGEDLNDIQVPLTEQVLDTGVIGDIFDRSMADPTITVPEFKDTEIDSEPQDESSVSTLSSRRKASYDKREGGNEERETLEDLIDDAETMSEEEEKVMNEDRIRRMLEEESLYEEDTDDTSHASLKPSGDENEDDHLSVMSESSSSTESETELRQRQNYRQTQHWVSKDGNVHWSRQPVRQSIGRRTSANIIRSKPDPTRYTTRNIDTAGSTWKLIFKKSVADSIIKWTNQEGYLVYKEKWVELDINEFERFLGLLILAGVYKSNNEPIHQLWSRDSGRPIFSKTMPRNRFQMLTRVLRFDDAGKRRQQKSIDKMSPIREVFEDWATNLQMCYIPSENLTIDEQLVTFRGRCPFKQYLPSKPGKYGLKFWVCCDSNTSYVCNIQLYVGRQVGQAREQNQGEMVVMDMVKGMEKSGRNITCDNYFTSLALGKILKRENLTLLGTIRKNRKELPAQLVTVKGRQLYTSVFAFNNDGSLVSYCPKKGKIVTLLSTAHHQPDTDATNVERKPIMILDYNRTKGGVETADQMVRTYTTKQKCKRWPMIVFYNMLDISALNSFIIWVYLNPDYKKGKSHKRRLFLIDLANELINNGDQVTRQTLALASNQEIGLQNPNTSTDTRVRGRCAFCPRLSDRKCRDRCIKCQKFACADHMTKVCSNCS